MEQVQFRRAEAADMAAIMAMQRETFHGEQAIPLKDIEAFLAMNPQSWIAEQGGALVGTASAWHEQGQLHWGRFIVSKPLRGQHIGTQLAAYSFTQLFSQNADVIFMEARETTVSIVCKMGGTVIGKARPFYKGTVTPVVLKKDDFTYPAAGSPCI